MRIADMIKDIRNAVETNRLVVFVGSGVSCNSGIPSWRGLIDAFVRELNLDKCEFCAFRDDICSYEDCKLYQHICQDEFLKIPQYFYDSHGEAYHELIKKTLNSTDAVPNIIDEIIFRILPHHIITTNFDKLLELSTEPNRQLYDLVASDCEMLGKRKSRYIIKMHGDFDSIDEIVLKESDYLEYEQRHPLMQTYIKSLLVDHCFLFIGYSFNDYNLKQIIGWRNYFAKQKGKTMPRNYIIQTSMESQPSYIIKSYEESNISFIDAKELPERLLANYQNLKLEEPGKMLYAILDCIYNENVADMLLPPDEVMLAKINPLDLYRAVSVEDFNALYSFGNAEVIGKVLTFNDKDSYEKWLSIISGLTEAAENVRNIIAKTFLIGIQYQSNKCGFEKFRQAANLRFELYLDNSYSRLISCLNDQVPSMEKAYYYHLLIPECANCFEELQKVPNEINQNENPIELLLYKYNMFLWKKTCERIGDFAKEKQEVNSILDNFPTQIKRSASTFQKLWRDITCDDGVMRTLLDKHIELYKANSNTIHFGSNLEYLLKLKAKAYDFYFYFKSNFLLIDHFSDPLTYFAPYIEAMLYTQSSIVSGEKNFLGMKVMPQEQYVLERIDLDIIIKYSEKKQFTKWIADLKVEQLQISDEIDIVHLYVNLIHSLSLSINNLIIRHIYIFSLVISLCDLCTERLEIISSVLCDLCRKITKLNDDQLESVLDSIAFIVRKTTMQNCVKMSELFSALTQENIIGRCSNSSQSQYEYLINSLSSAAASEDIARIQNFLDNCQNNNLKVRMLYLFRTQFLKAGTKLKAYVESNVKLLANRELLRLLIGKFIDYSDELQQMLIETIDKEISLRAEKPNERTYPDRLQNAIEILIILYLSDFPISLSKLEKYTSFSDFIEFIISPNDFDYSKIDTGNYMWQNFFNTEKTFTLLQAHASSILTERLKQKCKKGLLTDDECRIIYGKLLTSSELWRWGRE